MTSATKGRRRASTHGRRGIARWSWTRRRSAFGRSWRVGELVAAQKATVGLATGGKSYQRTGTEKDPVAAAPISPARPDIRPTLANAGIDKHLADRARKLAALPPDAFEAKVSDWQQQE